ncbi:MAG: hypothetical protein H7A23_27150 [Leptospiraceae bacterium]|nr:hypothetical protein [Leptospiraceae bacterium]
MESLNNFWEWYLNLFSNPDDKIKIAAWAATITTFTFFLNFVGIPLILRIKRSLEKIHLDIGFSHRFISTGSDLQVMPPVLTCTVTNRSNNSVYINKPCLKISKPINGRNKFSTIHHSDEFPLKLEPGQQKKDELNTLDLMSQLFDNEEMLISKVRFEVSSTSGKIYRSKKIKVKDILEQLEVAGNQNFK